MALPQAVGIAVPRLARLSWRAVELAVVPATDGAALLAAAWFVRGIHWTELAFILVVCIALNARSDIAARRNPRLGDDLGPLLSRIAVPLLLLIPMAGSGPALRQLAWLAVASAVMLLVGRKLSYGALRTIRSRGLTTESVVIVGAGRVGVEMASALLDHVEYGLAPIGFIDFDHDHAAELPLAILGEPRDLPAVLEEYQVRRVIVAFADASDADLGRVLETCQRLGAEIYVVPRFFERSPGPRGFLEDDLWGFTVARLRNPGFNRADRTLKRIFDVTAAAGLLVLLAPLLGIAALAVKLSSPGPVLFRQKRVTEGGRLFEVLKFRTMRENDDSDTQWSASEGITGVGKLLRSSSIDELPQLVNVLKGEMSLVGPRPERPHFVDQFNITVDGYEERHRMPGGITGWAQVHGLRGDTSIVERARFDNRYIAGWGVWLDMVVLGRTVGAILRMMTHRGKITTTAELSEREREA